MKNNSLDSTIALAGIFQATYLVQQAARKGKIDPEPFEISIRSIFQTSPENTEAVYGGRAGINAGLRILIDQFDGKTEKRDIELTKYVISVMHLERQLAKHPDMLSTISSGIDKAKIQVEHFPHTHENVIANLANIYTQTISTLKPRIIVNGEHGYLSQPAIANKVRALLLAAIRSAVLWYQRGGRRSQLIFKRRKIAEEARQLAV